MLTEACWPDIQPTPVMTQMRRQMGQWVADNMHVRECGPLLLRQVLLVSQGRWCHGCPSESAGVRGFCRSQQDSLLHGWLWSRGCMEAGSSTRVRSPWEWPIAEGRPLLWLEGVRSALLLPDLWSWPRWLSSRVCRSSGGPCGGIRGTRLADGDIASPAGLSVPPWWGVCRGGASWRALTSALSMLEGLGWRLPGHLLMRDRRAGCRRLCSCWSGLQGLWVPGHG